MLFYCGGTHLLGTGLTSSVLHLIAAVTGVLFLVGLFTPVVGTAIAAVELWVWLGSLGNPLIAIVLAILGASVAMIGPGVWSIDARIYGRKRIDPVRPHTA